MSESQIIERSDTSTTIKTGGNGQRLAIPNLIPILPLDGGRIVASLLPSCVAVPFARLEPFGIPVLMLLLVTKVVDLAPLVGASSGLIRGLAY